MQAPRLCCRLAHCIDSTLVSNTQVAEPGGVPGAAERLGAAARARTGLAAAPGQRLAVLPGLAHVHAAGGRGRVQGRGARRRRLRRRLQGARRRRFVRALPSPPRMLRVCLPSALTSQNPCNVTPCVCSAPHALGRGSPCATCTRRGPFACPIITHRLPYHHPSSRQKKYHRVQLVHNLLCMWRTLRPCWERFREFLGRWEISTEARAALVPGNESKMAAGVQCRRLDQAGLVQINGNMRMLPAGLLTLAREVRVTLLPPRDRC